MTAFVIFSLQICIEHNISDQPGKFQLSRMSGSNFTEGVDNIPPSSAVPGEKSPLLLWLTLGALCRRKTKIIEQIFNKKVDHEIHLWNFEISENAITTVFENHKNL